MSTRNKDFIGFRNERLKKRLATQAKRAGLTMTDLAITGVVEFLDRCPTPEKLIEANTERLKREASS